MRCLSVEHLHHLYYCASDYMKLESVCKRIKIGMTEKQKNGLILRCFVVMHWRDVLFLRFRSDCVRDRVKLVPVLKHAEGYEDLSLTVFFGNASLKYCAPSCPIPLSLRLREESV